jgi:hypothetical protein
MTQQMHISNVSNVINFARVDKQQIFIKKQQELKKKLMLLSALNFYRHQSISILAPIV